MTKIRHSAFLLLFLTVCLASSCNRAEIAVCNGYSLVRMNGSEFVIASPAHDILTNGTVVRYAVSSPYITGYTSKNGFPKETNPVEGYFFINTATGQHVNGMSDSQWNKQLSDVGWKAPQWTETNPLPRQ